MTSNEIAGYRLVSQQLASTQIKSASEMVKWFGAVQGQEYELTKWGLGLRLPHLIEPDIEKELNEGNILRTHLLRPTWHFVNAGDIGWLLKLTAPGIHRANAYMYRQSELDEKIFNRCNDILIAMLRGGNQLTRNEINEEFKKHKIIAAGPRLGYIMMNAELEGIICSGARKGRQFTYALLDERVKYKNPTGKDEALAELANRYFKSRSPATVRDFSVWSGLTITECKKGIETIRQFLDKVVIGKQEYYLHHEVSVPDRLSDKCFLLPVYDEFIMGYKDRSAIMPVKDFVPFSYISMIIYGGQVIGTWKRTISGNAINVEFEFFKPLNKIQYKAFGQAVNRLGEFLNMKVNKTIEKQRLNQTFSLRLS